MITAAKKVSQPVLAVPVADLVSDCLNALYRDREGWMRLLGDALHCKRHPLKEEALCFLLAAMAIWRGNQLLCLGNRQGSKQFREDRLQ